jgi:signal transduction histidine kinase
MPLEISLKKKNQKVLLIFKDHGPGIAPENQQIIFQRFERGSSPREISGLGLGLYITKQIIEAHKGSIRLESDLGKGTAFYIELPLILP